MKSGKKSHSISLFFSYLILVLMTLAVLYPLSAIFLSAFKTMKDFMGNPLGIPASFTFDNFIYAWGKMKFGTYTVNSVFITAITIFIIAITGAMAGFKLSQPFKGSRALYLYLLAGMAIPTQSFIITLFNFLKDVHMLSTYQGLIFTYASINLPFAIFIFSAFFRTLPKDLSEAAQLDGCTELRAFRQILLPLSKPTVATVIIISGMNVWNDFFVQMIINMDQKKYTLPMGLLKFRGETSVNWTPLFAGIVLVAVPIIVLFIAVQKEFIKGLTSGAVKG